jgi:hypothetical protein
MHFSFGDFPILGTQRIHRIGLWVFDLLTAVANTSIGMEETTGTLMGPLIFGL